VEDMPAKRRGFLMTSPGVGKRFYSRELGFWDVQEEQEYAICMPNREQIVVLTQMFADALTQV
jgi:hypothetical protein